MPRKVARKLRAALPLCPDCGTEMIYRKGGPFAMVGNRPGFELTCPTCKKSLSDFLHAANLQMREETPHPEATEEKLRKILERVDRLPVIDRRSEDEILGYDKYGVPS